MSVARDMAIWNGDVTMVLLPFLQMLRPQTQTVCLPRLLLSPGQKESGMGTRGKFRTLICMVLCKNLQFHMCLMLAFQLCYVYRQTDTRTLVNPLHFLIENMYLNLAFHLAKHHKKKFNLI